MLGHCGLFKVIVIEQFVWNETKTRSISIDFVLTVSSSENQISFSSPTESIRVNYFFLSIPLWPWSSIWVTELSLRLTIYLSDITWFLMASSWGGVRKKISFSIEISFMKNRGHLQNCPIFSRNHCVPPCKLFMIRTWIGSNNLRYLLFFSDKCQNAFRQIMLRIATSGRWIKISRNNKFLERFNNLW